MAKLIEEEITKADLQEYVDDYSDFSFEMDVLNSFTSEFKVEHGGTYEDPITEKFREFDMRATYTYNDPFEYNIYLAVEAKNLRKNFPLLISSIPRAQEEAYHQIIVSKYEESSIIPAFPDYGKVINISFNHNSMYKSENYVGKSLDQVGRRSHDDELTSNDSEVFSKWTQAINSSYDLAQKAYYLSEKDITNKVCISFVMPILVVPNETLWSINFDRTGKQLNDPDLQERCDYFIGNEFELGDRMNGDYFSLSHLHFMTLNGFRSFLENIKSYKGSIFPSGRIKF